MSAKEKELRERFDGKSPTDAVVSSLEDVLVSMPQRPVVRGVGRPDVCSLLSASEMTRKHTVTEFSSLTATEPTQTHRDLTWKQLMTTVAPRDGFPSSAKASIPLYIAGALKCAPWVAKTRETKDAARELDSRVPTEGLQRSNAHIAGLDAAVGDIDDKPSAGKRGSVWDVSKRLQRLGVAHVAYKSWSGVTGGSESGRVVAAIDRSIPPEEYADFFRAWQEICGNQLDNAGQARSQAYYKFGVPTGTLTDDAGQWRRDFDGYVLSVDKMVVRGKALDARGTKKPTAFAVVSGNESAYWKAKLALDVLDSDDYALWVKIGAALRREFGESGFSLWQEWSKKSAKCNPQELHGKWESFDLAHDTEARLATLHYHAGEAAKTIVEKKIINPAARSAVGLALAYLHDAHPSDPVHAHLKECSRVSPDLEREARKILEWHALHTQVEPRRPILYGPGLVQQAMRELASALAPLHRVFVRDGQLVRLVRAGEVLGSAQRSWHSLLSEDALLFVVIQKPQELIVEADPRVAMIAASDTVVKSIWAPTSHVMVPRFRAIAVASELAQSVLHYGSELGFRKLEGVIQHPTLRSDDSILDVSGFDDRSGWLYEANCAYPAMCAAPTRDDALQALARVADLYAEFPFADPDHPERAPLESASFSAALAALLTRALPIVLDCRKPIFALNGPTAGSGKTTLDALPALVFSGREPVTHVLSLDPRESKKEILALLLEGHLDITLDNVNGLLDSAELSSLTTADEFSGRILGTTRTARVKPRANWHVNGNGLAFKGDLRSRAVWHELDPRVARPDERRFGRDLRDYIHSHRAHLVVDVLTIVLAYRRAASMGGVPDAVLNAPPRSRFARWEDYVRKPLLWLDLPDPLGNRNAAFATDIEEEHINSFLRAVDRAQAGSALATAKNVAAAAAKALQQSGNSDAAAQLVSVVKDLTVASDIIRAVRNTVLSAPLDAIGRSLVGNAIAQTQNATVTVQGLAEKFTVVDLVGAALGPDGSELGDALADLGVNRLDVNVRRALGYKLRPIVGRIVGGRRLVRAGRSPGTGSSGGAVLWRLERVEFEQGALSAEIGSK